jgi:hypothetical protein
MTKKELKQKEYEEKLIFAVRNFPHGRMMGEDIIKLAEKYGVYKGSKFENKEKSKIND